MRLFTRTRPGPNGRTIEEPGIIPVWLCVAVSVGVVGIFFFGLIYQVSGNDIFHGLGRPWK